MNSRVGYRTTLELEKVLKEYIDAHTKPYDSTGRKIYTGETSYLLTYQNLIEYNKGSQGAYNK